MENFKYSKIIVILIVVVVLFVAYYALIARPKIKADCLGASTNIVSKGEKQTGIFENRVAISEGEEVVFDEAKYNDCVKLF